MKSKNFLNIVLFEPEIPQNTGNIARMCVANDLRLHLIKPLGFEIEDKYLKRSAMDYWQYLNYVVHEDWESFLESEKLERQVNELLIGKVSVDENPTLYFLSSKAKKIFWEIEYKTSDYLVFGSESKGLRKDFYETYQDRLITVPMSSENARCLNLASTVQTVYYEAFRQLQ